MSLPTFPSRSQAATRRRNTDRQIEQLRSSRGILSGGTIEDGRGLTIKNGGKITVADGIIEATFVFLRARLWPGKVTFENWATDGSGWSIDVGRITNETGSAAEIAGINTGLPIVLNSTALDVRATTSTTSNAANVYIDPTTGRLSRSTSTSRDKLDIKDATVSADDVRKLRLRTWRDALEVEADPDTPTRYTGLVAEEVDKLATLKPLVTRDEEGKPNGLAEGRFYVALLALAKDQDQQITDLRATVTALADRLTALESQQD